MTEHHPHIRRNMIALGMDYLAFAIGVAFYDPLVVVPAFVKELTGSEMVIGALAALRTIMITVPQIWAASILHASTRKRPLLIWSSVGGRIPVLLLAIATLLWASSYPWLIIGVLAISVMFFYTSEGLNSISWPDLVGKVIPEEVRGRFLGTGQLISSFGSLIAGGAVRAILAQKSLTFPANWSLLYVLGFVGLMGSVVSMFFIRERAEPVQSDGVNVGESLRRMRIYLKRDPRLQRMIAIQFLLGSASASFSFFIVRAQELVPYGSQMVGNSLIARNVGAMAGALLCGLLVDHVGSWFAVRVETLMATLALAVAVLAGFLPWALPLYLVAFVFLGFVSGSSWWTFTAYLMDIATEQERPTYLATSGIITSPTFLASLIAGAVATKLRLEILFAAALVIDIAAFALSLGIKGDEAEQPPNAPQKV